MSKVNPHQRKVFEEGTSNTHSDKFIDPQHHPDED